MIDLIMTIPCIAICLYLLMGRVAGAPIDKREAIFAALRIALLSTLLTLCLVLSLAAALHYTIGLDPSGKPRWFGAARIALIYVLALGVSPIICTYSHLKNRMSLTPGAAAKVALSTGLVTVVAFPVLYIIALLLFLPFALMGGLAMSANVNSIARNSVR